MTVEVRLHKSLGSQVAGYDEQDGLRLDWLPGLTPAVVLKELGVPLDQVRMIVVNGNAAEMSTLVADGEVLSFFPAA